jgi:hypothetical protein
VWAERVFLVVVVAEEFGLTEPEPPEAQRQTAALVAMVR